jgi:short-subunit dehydrogenase
MSDQEFFTKYGPYALVAGASRGIGAELANQLAAKGLNVVTIARNLEQLEANATAMRTRHRVNVVPLRIDLADKDAAEQIVAQTSALDVGLLVYNAAIGFSGAFWAKDLDYYHDLLAINILTPFDLVYWFAPKLMRQRRGGIIMISSAAGITPQPYLTAYAGTKGWNTQFSLSLSEELRPYGVDLFTAIVGSTDTPGLHDMMQESFLKSVKLAPRAEVVAEILENLGKRPSRIIGKDNRMGLGLVRHMGINRSLKMMSDMSNKNIYGGKPPIQPID